MRYTFAVRCDVFVVRWNRPAGPDPGFVEHLGGGSGFWNAMRWYPQAGTGVVVMGNTTRYHHDRILAPPNGDAATGP
jgi:hypothetical protein